MNDFITLSDLPDFKQTLDLAMDFKKNPYKLSSLGKGKTLGCCFLIPA